MIVKDIVAFSGSGQDNISSLSRRLACSAVRPIVRFFDFRSSVENVRRRDQK